MKKADYLKSMFDFVKKMGGMKEYEDFDDYNLRKFGVGKTEEIKEKFVSTLEGKEKADFLEMFGEEDG